MTEYRLMRLFRYQLCTSILFMVLFAELFIWNLISPRKMNNLSFMSSWLLWAVLKTASQYCTLTSKLTNGCHNFKMWHTYELWHTYVTFFIPSLRWPKLFPPEMWRTYVTLLWESDVKNLSNCDVCTGMSHFGVFSPTFKMPHHANFLFLHLET